MQQLCKEGESGDSTGPNFRRGRRAVVRRSPDGVAIPWNGVTDSKFGLPTNER